MQNSGCGKIPVVIFPIDILPLHFLSRGCQHNDTNSEHIHKTWDVCGLLCCRLMLGVMVPAWCLSMWITNTATTAMMVPIVCAILQQFQTTKHDRDVDSVQDEDEQGT